MSIDMAWTAQSLQAPVHNHLSRVSADMDRIFGGGAATRGVSNSLNLNRPLPDKGPQAVIARNNLEQAILGLNRPTRTGDTGVFATATPAPGVGVQTSHRGTSPLDFIRQQAAKTNVVQPTDAPKQPGIDPAVATAVPGAPSTGIPQMPQISGWSSPGANFSISQVR